MEARQVEYARARFVAQLQPAKILFYILFGGFFVSYLGYLCLKTYNGVRYIDVFFQLLFSLKTTTLLKFVKLCFFAQLKYQAVVTAGLIGLWIVYTVLVKKSVSEKKRGALRDDEASIRAKHAQIVIPCKDGRVIEIPPQFENQHFLIIGTTGTGKTVTYNYFLRGLLKNLNHKKIIIHDPKGDYTSYLYGRDDVVLFAPADGRTIKWDIIPDLVGVEGIPLETLAIQAAESLIPSKEESAEDKFWSDAARQILTGVLLRVVEKYKQSQNGFRGNYEFKKISSLPAEKLYNEVAKCQLAKRYIEKLAHVGQGDRTALSMYSTFNTRILKILPLVPDDGSFSLINDFLEKDDKRILILGNLLQIKETIAPLFGLALLVLGRNLLTKGEAKRTKEGRTSKQTWFLLDEFGNAGHSAVFQELLTLGRSKGICIVIGLQDVAQLKEAGYGEGFITSLKNNTNIFFIFRLNDEKEAETLAKMLGEMEEERLRESFSVGEKIERGISYSSQREQKLIVLPSEIQNLPNLNFFLKIPGYPIARFEVPYWKFEEVAPSFVPSESGGGPPSTQPTMENVPKEQVSSKIEDVPNIPNEPNEFGDDLDAFKPFGDTDFFNKIKEKFHGARSERAGAGAHPPVVEPTPPPEEEPLPDEFLPKFDDKPKKKPTPPKKVKAKVVGF